jgi:hypothetical protein
MQRVKHDHSGDKRHNTRTDGLRALLIALVSILDHDIMHLFPSHSPKLAGAAGVLQWLPVGEQFGSGERCSGYRGPPYESSTEILERQLIPDISESIAPS